MELRFLEGNFEHGKFKLQYAEPVQGMKNVYHWHDVPCVKDEPERKKLAQICYEAYKNAPFIESFNHVAESALTAVIEVYEEWKRLSKDCDDTFCEKFPDFLRERLG
jgi:hypothetical protein